MSKTLTSEELQYVMPNGTYAMKIQRDDGSDLYIYGVPTGPLQKEFSDMDEFGNPIHKMFDKLGKEIYKHFNGEEIVKPKAFA